MLCTNLQLSTIYCIARHQMQGKDHIETFSKMVPRIKLPRNIGLFAWTNVPCRFRNGPSPIHKTTKLLLLYTMNEQLINFKKLALLLTRSISYLGPAELQQKLYLTVEIFVQIFASTEPSLRGQLSFHLRLESLLTWRGLFHRPFPQQSFECVVHALFVFHRVVA